MRTRDRSFYECFIAPEEDQRQFKSNENNEFEEIIRSVKVLLNTRSPYSLSVCSSLSRRTVLDYGLPDFLHLSPLSRAASYQLARAVKETIVAHEPRLTVTSVEVHLPRPCRDVFRLQITGTVNTISGKKEMISFPVDVN